MPTVRFIDGPEAGKFQTFSNPVGFTRTELQDPPPFRYADDDVTPCKFATMNFRFITMAKRIAGTFMWDCFIREDVATSGEANLDEFQWGLLAKLVIRVKPFPSILSDFNEWFRWMSFYHLAPTKRVRIDLELWNDSIYQIGSFLCSMDEENYVRERFRSLVSSMNPDNPQFWRIARERPYHESVFPVSSFYRNSPSWLNQPTEPKRRKS